MKLISITIFQKNISEGLSLSMLKDMANIHSNILVLPQYFFADENASNIQLLLDKYTYAYRWLLRFIGGYSGILIGGTLLRKYTEDASDAKVYASTPILVNNEIVDYYDKNILDEQEKDLCTPGSDLGIFSLQSTRFGVISENKKEDVESLCAKLAAQGISLIFCLQNIVVDPEDANSKESMQDDITFFTQLAKKYNIYIIRCCATGKLLNSTLAGRSLAVTPNGINWKVGFEEQNSEFLKTLIIQIPTIVQDTAVTA